MRSLITLFLALLSTTLFAANTIGDAAGNLYAPVSALTMLMEWACYVVGAALLIGAVMQFRIHFQNPKLTPLFTPILMTLIGIGLILLPYFSLLPGNSWSADAQDSQERSRYQEAQQELYQEQQGGSSGGHWSQNPRYKR